jgi:hypothetical protein
MALIRDAIKRIYRFRGKARPGGVTRGGGGHAEQANRWDRSHRRRWENGECVGTGGYAYQGKVDNGRRGGIKEKVAHRKVRNLLKRIHRGIGCIEEVGELVKRKHGGIGLTCKETGEEDTKRNRLHRRS